MLICPNQKCVSQRGNVEKSFFDIYRKIDRVDENKVLLFSVDESKEVLCVFCGQTAKEINNT